MLKVSPRAFSITTYLLRWLFGLTYLIFVQASKGVIDLSKANQPSAGALSGDLKGSRFPQRPFSTLATTGIQLFVLSEMRQKGAK